MLVVIDDHKWDSEEQEATYLAKKLETCLNAIDNGQAAKLYSEVFTPGKERIIRIMHAKPIPEWIQHQLLGVFTNKEVAALNVSLEFSSMDSA